MLLNELQKYREKIEEGLSHFLPTVLTVPKVIHEAMRYSTCGGGKRIRGLLTLLACQVVGGEWKNALPAACAIEMIHSYSLIHDDLPCMDDDALRRGKPTNHRIYGEDIALLAGDALLTQAVETMLEYAPSGLEMYYWKALQELIKASNTEGMIGGQVLDLEAEGKVLNLQELQEIHRRKTGALIKAAIGMGGIIGGGTEEEIEALSNYGEALGLAFQITDDLLDREADPKILGKAVGSDIKNHKATYPGIVGVEESRRLAALEMDKACKALQPFGERGMLLQQFAKELLKRDH